MAPSPARRAHRARARRLRSGARARRRRGEDRHPRAMPMQLLALTRASPILRRFILRWSAAPKGHDIPAQGNALGPGHSIGPALKGRDIVKRGTSLHPARPGTPRRDRGRAVPGRIAETFFFHFRARGLTQRSRGQRTRATKQAMKQGTDHGFAISCRLIRVFCRLHAGHHGRSPVSWKGSRRINRISQCRPTDCGLNLAPFGAAPPYAPLPTRQ